MRYSYYVIFFCVVNYIMSQVLWIVNSLHSASYKDMSTLSSRQGMRNVIAMNVSHAQNK